MPFFKSSEDYFKEMTSTLNDVDTSKPGFIYNSLRPASYEFSYQSMMMDEIIKMMFVKTQLSSKYYDYLLERCSEMGIERKIAEAAIGKVKITGKPNSKFPSGSLVSTSTGLTYIINNDLIIDATGIGYVGVTATETGSKYNVDVGEINVIPVRYEGILSVTNEEKISNGYDDETYEALYERYLLKVQTPATSGNKYHYQNWALEVDGVGSAKVYPLWNGNIVSGKSIFGLWGNATPLSMGGKRYASGSNIAVPSTATVTVNLPFTPSIVYLEKSSSDKWIYFSLFGKTYSYSSQDLLQITNYYVTPISTGFTIRSNSSMSATLTYYAWE